MRNSIEILHRQLCSSNINDHVICPSAKERVKNISDIVDNGIEIIDERSAGYVATGICAETNKPVVIWCAENESYRNLASALTEAYYRKLPILIVALSTKDRINQQINPTDTIRYYVNNSVVLNRNSESEALKAIEYLNSPVKGPVYLSLTPINEILNINKEESTDSCDLIDVTPIIEIIPTDVCVHIGRNFDSYTKKSKEIIKRTNRNIADGCLSMLIGSACIEKNQLHVGIFSSEEIHYDLNMIGNRHVGKNVAIICIIKEKGEISVLNFAKKLRWKCNKIYFSEIELIGKMLSEKRDEPLYIEIML